MEGMAFILALLVIALIITAPTYEGMMAKGPYTIEPSIPIPVPSHGWVSPWDQPTDTQNTIKRSSRIRPYTNQEDCAKVAGKLAAFMCTAPGSTHLN